MQTVTEVFEQIQRSVRTLRKLPPVSVKNRFCNWPDIIRSFYECYGWNDPDPPKIVPTARQLTELDQVISWLAWLSKYGEEGEYAKIIWARAERRSWRHIGTVVGLSKDTCRERFRVGMYALHHALNERQIKNQ